MKDYPVTPAVRSMRHLAAAPLTAAALLCLSGGLLYLFFAEAVELLHLSAPPPTHDPVELLQYVQDGMIFLEVLLLLLLLGGLWWLHLSARYKRRWKPLPTLRWIHGVILAEFVYEMLVLALALAANLMDAVMKPRQAGYYLLFSAGLVAIGAVTVVLHHQAVGALHAGRITLQTGQPCLRHLSVTTAVLIFVLSAAALVEPAAWLTAIGEALLGVILLRHRRNMKRETKSE